jgi:hypothetical protein
MVDGVLDIKKVGNVKQFTLDSRFLERALIKTNNVAVKAYYMHSNEARCNENSKISFANLEHEILETRLENTQCGMGFAIISELDKDQMLYNVNMWGKETPFLLFPSIYLGVIAENRPRRVFSELSANRSGSLCLYEMKIANYEAGEWTAYLESKRTTKDKEKYLHNLAPSDLLKK